MPAFPKQTQARPARGTLPAPLPRLALPGPPPPPRPAAARPPSEHEWGVTADPSFCVPGRGAVQGAGCGAPLVVLPARQAQPGAGLPPGAPRTALCVSVTRGGPGSQAGSRQLRAPNTGGWRVGRRDRPCGQEDGQSGRPGHGAKGGSEGPPGGSPRGAAAASGRRSGRERGRGLEGARGRVGGGRRVGGRGARGPYLLALAEAQAERRHALHAQEAVGVAAAHLEHLAQAAHRAQQSRGRPRPARAARHPRRPPLARAPRPPPAPRRHRRARRAGRRVGLRRSLPPPGAAAVSGAGGGRGRGRREEAAARGLQTKGAARLRVGPPRGPADLSRPEPPPPPLTQFPSEDRARLLPGGGGDRCPGIQSSGRPPDSPSSAAVSLPKANPSLPLCGFGAPGVSQVLHTVAWSTVTAISEEAETQRG